MSTEPRGRMDLPDAAEDDSPDWGVSKLVQQARDRTDYYMRSLGRVFDEGRFELLLDDDGEEPQFLPLLLAKLAELHLNTTIDAAEKWRRLAAFLRTQSLVYADRRTTEEYGPERP